MMTVVELRGEHKVMTDDYVLSLHQASRFGAEVGAPLVDRTSTLLPNSVATKATISSMEVGQALCSPGEAGISHR
jgi:hypothetical protein